MGDAPYQEGRALFRKSLGALEKVLLSEGYHHSDIRGTAVLDSAAQASAFPVPLSSEPAEIQGPILKRHLGPQSGTVFA